MTIAALVLLNEITRRSKILAILTYCVFPVVLVGSAYWSPLVSWLRDTVAKEGKILAADLDLVLVSDDPHEIVTVLVEAEARRRQLVDEWGNIVGVGAGDPPPPFSM